MWAGMRMTRSRSLIVGLTVGLIVGGIWPEAPLHAVATHGQENFAIATGHADDRIEALYFLDYLTGNLQAAVLSISTGQFIAYYEKNILQDLEIESGRTPRYMMVTGFADLRRVPGRIRPAASVCYVADATTGKVAAYTIPWIGGQVAAGAAGAGPIEAPLVLLSVTKFRIAEVRDN